MEFFLFLIFPGPIDTNYFLDIFHPNYIFHPFHISFRWLANRIFILEKFLMREALWRVYISQWFSMPHPPHFCCNSQSPRTCRFKL
jgi:hypothetical protein